MLGVGLSVTSTAVQGRWSPPAALIDLDFRQDRYSVAGAAKTFDEVFVYNGSGLRTFHNAAGDLVWNAHNLVLNSETPATQTVAVAAGATYTAAMSGIGSVELSGAGTGTATDGAPIAVAAADSSLILTVTGAVSRFWLYRSDLGGMADNPDNTLGVGFESYVPTGAAAVYKPRRNADLNGQPAGVRFESEAAANQVLQSHSLDAAPWSSSNGLTVTAAGSISGTPAWKLEDARTDAFGFLSQTLGVISTVTTTSVRVRKTEGAATVFGVRLTVGPSSQFCGIMFNTDTGAINDKWNAGLIDRGAEDMGDHWLAWFAVDMAAVTDPHTTVVLHVFPAHNSVGGSAAADHTGKHTCTAFQVEAGYMPSSYIPTAGSTVTRPAEALSVRASALPAVMPEAVSFAMAGCMTYVDDGTYDTIKFFDWVADADARIEYSVDTFDTETGEVNFKTEQQGTFYKARTTADAYLPGVNVPFAVAGKHAANSVVGAASGVLTTQDVSLPSMPDLTGANINLALAFNGYISRFQKWDSDVGDRGIEQISA